MIETSRVCVDLDGSKPKRAIRLYVENSLHPTVTIDFWKSGVVRRISETPLADLPADQLDLEAWDFPILEDHKLGANIPNMDRYPNSHIGFTNRTVYLGSEGRMWCAVDNAQILKESQTLQEKMGIYRKSSVMEQSESNGGILLKDFVEGQYPTPPYFSKCELNLMK